MQSHANRSCLTLVLFAAAAAGITSDAHALPVWQVTNADVHLEGEGRADCYINNGPGVVDVQLSALRNTLIGGFQGLSYGNRFGFDAVDKNFIGPPVRESVVVASSKAKATIAGDGTQEIVIEWLIRSSTESDALDGYDAQSWSAIQSPNGDNFFVELDTTGVPAGTPLIIYYSWDASSRGFNREDPPGGVWPGVPAPQDYARLTNASLRINGADVLGPNFSFDIQPPFVGVNYSLKNQSGQLNITAGQTIRIDVTGLAETGIFQTGQGWTQMEDLSVAQFYGRIRLSTGTPPIPTPTQPTYTPLIDFSIDIGSDTEMSAMPPTGNEVFDPGDVYAWRGTPMMPPGANGYRNDSDWFMGLDPLPVAGAFGPPTAPVCSGLPILLVAPQYLDLDGHDALEFSIHQALQSGVRLPFPYFDSHCINAARYLLISLDDDQADPYTTCDVPNNRTAPSGLTYGDTASRSEVYGVTLTPFPPYAVLNFYPFASETQVHPSLGPDPTPGSEADDDDVDSLDAPFDPTICGYFYFSVDHEATGVDPITGSSLDPGAIYEAVPGGAPIKVIDHRQLGIPFGFDLADFEFVWLENVNAPGNPVQLAVVFAVHPDDPATPMDESGGLNPKRLYASFLTGSHFPLFAGVFPDPIDGVTTVREEMDNLPHAPPQPCMGDANNDGIVNFGDITSVLANFGNTYPPGVVNGPGDANHDGVVNFADITAVLANFGNICP